MKTCRLTFNPEKEVELSDTDFTDMSRQGLVVPESVEEDDVEGTGDVFAGDDVDTGLSATAAESDTGIKP